MEVAARYLKIDPPPVEKQVLMGVDWVDLDNEPGLKSLMALPKRDSLFLQFMMEAPLQQVPLDFAKEGYCYLSRDQYVELIGPLAPDAPLDEACEIAFGKQGDTELTPRQKHNRTLYLAAVPHFESHSCNYHLNQVEQVQQPNKREFNNVLSLDEFSNTKQRTE